MTDDKTTSPDAAAATETRRGKYGWLSLTIAIVFGLFYAYDLFEAISNVAVLPSDIAAENTFRVAGGLSVHSVPWALLIADLLVSPVAYAAAFLLGRRRSVFVTILCFVVGLTVVSAVSLTLVALA